MPLRDMRTPSDHQLCPVRERPVSCDLCRQPAVQEWSAPNGSYGHFCSRHRHKYGTFGDTVILVPEHQQEGERR